MITERTLRQWRRDALKDLERKTDNMPRSPEQLSIEVLMRAEMNGRILRLTQELLDQALIRKVG